VPVKLTLHAGLILHASLSIVALSVASDATAQEASRPQTNAPVGTDEIIVTARKREESLQDTPFSLTAFTAESLQQVGAVNIEDIALQTVNFNTVQQVGRRLDRPTVRGQSSSATGGEANAGYFIDGVFVSGSLATATLGPIERVEILRGPQSALFGRATFSGAVNYVTRQPTNEFTGEAQGKAGSNETRNMSAWASGPIVRDDLLFFASVGWDRYGGEWRNSLRADQAPTSIFVDPPQFGDNTRLGGIDSRDVVGKLLWTPNDASTVTLKLGYTKSNDNHYAQLIQEPGELNCFLPTADNIDEPWYATSQGAFCGTIDGERVQYANDNPFNPNSPSFNPTTYLPNSPNLLANLPAQGGRRQSRLNLPDFRNGMELVPTVLPFFPNAAPADLVASPEEPGTRRVQKRALLEFEQGLGDWTSTFRATFNRDELEQGFDLDRTEQRFLTGTFSMFEKLELDDHSFEVRLDSPSDAALRGSIGVYYFKSESESRQKQFVGLAQGQFSDPTLRDIENVAAFGSLEYSLNDAWTLSAEARYANDQKSIATNLSCDDDPTTPEIEGEQVRDTTDTDSFTPRFTVRYQPNDTTTLYALVAKGNKPAEFNTAYFRQSTANACESIVAIEEGATRIEEEKAWTYEVGTKNTWLDGRISSNLSLFYIDWENQSVFQTTLVGNTLTQITRNAGKSEVSGLELETAFIITDNLTGNFSYGLADGKFLNYSDPAFANTTGIGLDEDGNLDNTSNNVKGNRLPSSPKHSFVMALDYTADLNAKVFSESTGVQWFARTNFVLESDRYTAADNFIKLPNRKLWSARLGLDSADWTVTTYVNNILDQQAPVSVFSFPYLAGLAWDSGSLVQGHSVFPTPGRQYGLDLIVRFGN
jgi:iron complex outermembrane receptor protein